MRNRKFSTVAGRQAPLRRAYAEDPERAITRKRSRTEERPGTDALHGTVVSPGFPGIDWAYGIDAKVGGFDDLPNPGHLLCSALAACVDSTVRMIADQLGVPVEHLEVEVTGDVDVRGCLALDRTVRPGFRQMQCEVRLRPAPEVPERLVRVVLDQAERLCVTLDTLRNGVPVTVSAGASRGVPRLG